MNLIPCLNKISLVKRVDSLLGNPLVNLLPHPVGTRKSSIRSVLFIRPGGIGDALLLAPAINTFRERFSNAIISVLAEKRNAGAFALIPSVDRLYIYDCVRDVGELLKSRYDLIIDTEQWHRLSAVCARILPSSIKIGFATNNRKNMFTDQVPYSHSDYEAQSFLNLLKPLGIEAQLDYSQHFLSLPDEAKNEITKFMEFKSPYVAIFPGASIKERRWGSTKFNDLALRLSSDGILPVIVGGIEDIVSGDAIIKGTCGLNLAGQTSLQGTAAIIYNSKLLISSDSGVLHIGAGLGVKTVSLFGPGIAEKWAPRGERHIAINRHLPCSPCTVFGTTPKCPAGGRCLEAIDVQDVYMAALTLINL